MIFLMMPLVVFLETLDDFSDDASSCFPRYA